MQNLQKTINWALIVTETSHVFCCVLPTLFSIISLLTGLGLVSGMPFWLDSLHHVIHGWELTIIGISGAVVFLGWGLYAYSRHIDCHDTGCHHGDCTPRKTRASNILIIASVLFVINLTVYTVIHRGMGVGMEGYHVHEGHDHGHDHQVHHGYAH